jgi:hypothetical protein
MNPISCSDPTSPPAGPETLRHGATHGVRGMAASTALHGLQANQPRNRAGECRGIGASEDDVDRDDRVQNIGAVPHSCHPTAGRNHRTAGGLRNARNSHAKLQYLARSSPPERNAHSSKGGVAALRTKSARHGRRPRPKLRAKWSRQCERSYACLWFVRRSSRSFMMGSPGRL